jgi:hypothetical protein
MKPVGSLVARVLDSQYTRSQAAFPQLKIRFCQRCLDFSNQFAAKAEQLLGATSDLAGVAGVGSKREVFEAARLEVQRLRAECDTVKADMKRHQAEHDDA